MVDIDIVTSGAVINTHKGEVIAIMNQYAYTGKGKTIHSCGQIEAYKIDVNDKSIKVGGQQRIVTPDGYIIPLNIKGGLPYMSMRPYTDKEFEELPHVILTADVDWDPSILDYDLEEKEEWLNTLQDMPTITNDQLFDEFGDYRHTYEVTEAILSDSVIENSIITDLPMMYSIYEREVKPRPINYDKYQSKFGWQPPDVIKKTFEQTTQYYRTSTSTHLKKTYKSPYPGANVPRRQEPVATDKVYSDTPAIDGGETTAQLFAGLFSTVSDIHGMKSEKQFVNTLQDNIRRRGAMTQLISDRAQDEISNKVQDILRNYMISDWQSEPYYQHQNPCERQYQNIKRMANTLLDRTGAPASLWLLALMYACYVLNRTANASLGYAIPLTILLGVTVDISPILQFDWYEPVYYADDEYSFHLRQKKP